MTSYSTAPPAEQPHVSSSGGEHSKWGDMLKKAGSNIGNAATWGFGAACKPDKNKGELVQEGA